MGRGSWKPGYPLIRMRDGERWGPKTGPLRVHIKQRIVWLVVESDLVGTMTQWGPLRAGNGYTSRCEP